MLNMDINYENIHYKLSNLRKITKEFVYNALEKSNIRYNKPSE